MKTVMLFAFLTLGVTATISAASANHEADWTKTFWEELQRNTGG